MSRRARLLVVGHGMLASHALAQLTRVAPDAFDITVFGAEPGPAYNRVLLSSWLAGDCTAGDLRVHDADWHAARRIRVHDGDPVVGIDRDRCVVRTAAGVVAGYDHLLLATGSRVAVPDVPGRALAGVHGFRNRDDVAAWLAAPRVPAIVVGGGVLGIEAAHGLARRGAAVTLVHAAAHLMDRELDAEAAAYVQGRLAASGIAIVLSRRCAAVLGDAAAVGVRLDDGRVLAAGRVVFATGITPEIALARACGLPCERGVLVDGRMRTADARVSALGECAQQGGRCYGLLAPLQDQVEPWLQGLLGGVATGTATPVPQTRLKVPGVDLFVAGDVTSADVERVVHRDGAAGVYRELRVRGGRLVGVRLCGDSVDAAACVAAIRSGAALGERRFTLSVGCEAA
jgi:nitrite reductase (NADH) large subunit